VGRGRSSLLCSELETNLPPEEGKMKIVCVRVLAALGLAAVSVTPAFAQFSGYYRIMARHSGKAVVVSGASTVNSANVVQWTYSSTGATNDEWELRDIGAGYYRVINRNSGKDLVVQSASTANAAHVIQYAYGGTATNDEWQPVDAGSGYHRLVNRNSGKVLDVSGASTADGATVDQWSWVNVNQEMFQLVSLSGGTTPTPTPAPTATPGGTVTPTPSPTPTPSGGGCTTVSSSSALSSAAASAGPGTCILVANGSYSGFTVTADGTSTSPITIRAANRGGATINSGTITLNGASYVTLEGFTITAGGSSLSVDNQTRSAAVFFINTNNSRLTRSTLRVPSTTSGWVYLGGNSNNNRIDHCEFGPGTTNKGFYIYPSGRNTISGVTAPAKGTSGYQSWANGGSPNNPNMARNTRIDRNYFHDKKSSTGEVMTLGGIGITGDYQDTFSLVENNLFVNCDGDAEMIASKSSSNTIRLNTVRTSVGMISLRAGNKCKVQDNIQIQGGKSGTAGIKIYEHDHTITGNYIDNPTDYALLIGAGDSYLSTSFGHAACERCVMDGNIAINLNARPAIIGHGGSGVAPRDCTFRNNQLRGSLSSLISTPNPGNTVISGNTTSGSNPPLPRTPLSTGDVGPNAP